jgi:hypothetical protein
MTPNGPIILCRHHARKFATTLRAYPSAPAGGARGARCAAIVRYERKASLARRDVAARVTHFRDAADLSRGAQHDHERKTPYARAFLS